MIRCFIYGFLVIILAGCHDDSHRLTIEEIAIPYTVNASSTPDLYVSPQGNIYLSWVSQNHDTSSLLYSKFESNQWTKAKVAATGRDWFVNWADFPSLATFPSSEYSVLAHYLEMTDTTGAYHYGVKLALSRDAGDRFRIIDSLHDSRPGEHGFASMVPYSFDKILIAWLDGGNQAASAPETGHHDAAMSHVGAAMQLKSSMVDFDGHILQPMMVDERVCDCCQTDACMTPKGPILVYRNRTEDEIRDIYYTIFTDGHWSTPKAIHDDQWKINGCPVNGPAIGAFGNRVAIAWYTEAGGAPSIKLAYSENAGLTFSKPFPIPTRHTLGRLDLVWKDEAHILVSFLDKQAIDSEAATIKLYEFSIIDGRSRIYELDQVSSKRKSGIPKMEKYYPLPSGESNLIMAYTQIQSDGSTRIKTIKVKW
jgi:hypothetical protein